MLVLSRNIKESILIHTLDGVIEVLVSRVKGGQVKLGITAPPSYQGVFTKAGEDQLMLQQIVMHFVRRYV